MKQRIEDDALLTADEIEVAEILLDLPRRIIESESRRRLFPWGGKRKRSIPGMKTASTTSPPPINNPSPPKRPPPSLPRNVLVLALETKSEAPSPASPLAFFPSELEENTKPIKTQKKKSSLKTRKEEQLHLIKELTQRKELMHKEIEKVRNYYEKLKSYNSALKSRRDELIGVVDVKEQSAGYQFGQISVPPPFNLQAIAVNQAAELLKGCDKSGVVWDGGRDNVGQAGMFDLNVSPEETAKSKCCEPLDRYSYGVRAAMSRAARLRRRQICDMKISTARIKPRVS